MQHLSLGLAELTRDMVKNGDKILDLGPLTCGTTQAFLSKNCHCYIEDLIDYLSGLKPGEDEKKALAYHMIPKPDHIKFDVILCWDILNFLDLDVIEYLFSLLEPHLKPGTIVHTMRYTGNHAPNKPKRFRLLQDFNFECQDDASYPQLTCRSHSTMTLLKSMRRFSLFNTVMQKQGMDNHVSEHFFEYDSSVSRKQIRSGSASDVSTYFESDHRYENIHLQALETFLASMPETASLLDCGKKTARNFEYVNRLVKQVFVEDLFASLTWQSRVSSGEDELLFSGSMLKFDQQIRFDGVFLWDLLNYCIPQQIESLMQLLAGLMNPGAKVYMVQFKTPGVSSTPLSFEVEGEKQVTICGDIEGEVKRPQMSTIELFRLMPQFRLTTHKLGFLNDGIGYQEYVLEYRPD